MDKMREAFEKWAKAECLDLDSVDGFYSDNDTHIAWGAWQAARAAAVPVVGHGMLEKFKLWRDERIGRHALIEPLEWFAGGYACAESNQEQTVPVVGEVVAWVNPDDRGILSSVGRVGWYELVKKPTTSITAAELDALRKNAVRVVNGT